MAEADQLEIECVAHNNEPPFERKKRAGAGSIHDDDVAQQTGFTGALVPGIVTSSYTMPVLIDRWGEAWLERGTFTARFRRPVYDNDTVSIRYKFGRKDDAEHAEIEVLREGESSVVGEASLPAGPTKADLGPFSGPALSAPDELVVIEPGKIKPGQPLYSEPFELTPEMLGALNRHIDLQPEDWPEDKVHPFVYMLTAAMQQQVGTSFSNPGIHYATHIEMIEPARPGDTLEATGRISDDYEHNGNHFFVAEQLIRTTKGQNVAFSRNTVLYKIRPAGGN